MSYSLEWIPVALVALIVLLLAPPLAMVAVVIVLLFALASLLALAATIAAAPYLLFRSVRSRRAHHAADRRNTAPLRRVLKPVPSRQM